MRELLNLIDKDVQTLTLDEDEKVVGAAPIHMGIRDEFDPTHSYSCGSVRDKISKWRLGAFITTSKHLIFRQMEENMSFTTALKVPLEGIYEVEVSGVREKRLEFCTDAGSFEFKGFDDERIYDFQKALQDLSDIARQQKWEREFPTIPLVICKYCGVKNKADASFCVNCGAPIK